eukprot:351369-Chlamydomonas_euryale.AAC.11
MSPQARAYASPLPGLHGAYHAACCFPHAVTLGCWSPMSWACWPARTPAVSCLVSLYATGLL